MAAQESPCTPWCVSFVNRKQMLGTCKPTVGVQRLRNISSRASPAWAQWLGKHDENMLYRNFFDQEKIQPQVLHKCYSVKAGEMSRWELCEPWLKPTDKIEEPGNHLMYISRRDSWTWPAEQSFVSEMGQHSEQVTVHWGDWVANRSPDLGVGF